MRYLPTSNKYASKTFLLTVAINSQQGLKHLKPSLLLDILETQNSNKTEILPAEKKVELAEDVLKFLKATDIANPTSDKDNPMSYIATGRKWVRTKKIKRIKYDIDSKSGTIKKLEN